MRNDAIRIAVHRLTMAVMVIPIVESVCRYENVIHLPMYAFVAGPYFPSFVRFRRRPTILRLPFQRVRLQASRQLTNDGNCAALFHIVRNAVGVVRRPVIFRRVAFVDRRFVVIFKESGRVHSFPVNPIRRIVANDGNVRYLMFTTQFGDQRMRRSVRITRFLSVHVPHSNSIHLIYGSQVTQVTFPLLRVL